jgi:hypothetical protein
MGRMPSMSWPCPDGREFAFGVERECHGNLPLVAADGLDLGDALGLGRFFRVIERSGKAAEFELVKTVAMNVLRQHEPGRVVSVGLDDGGKFAVT